MIFDDESSAQIRAHANKLQVYRSIEIEIDTVKICDVYFGTLREILSLVRLGKIAIKNHSLARVNVNAHAFRMKIRVIC